MRSDNYIVMYSGAELEFLRPEPCKIQMSDIAHHLSQVNRFCGGLYRPYSVADHSVYVANLFEGEDELRRYALMHDATEAFLGDVIAPLKDLLPGYKVIERLWTAAIATRFSLAWTPAIKKAIKIADGIALLAELRDLGAHKAHLSWPPSKEARVSFNQNKAPKVYRSWSAAEAEERFIREAARVGYDLCVF